MHLTRPSKTMKQVQCSHNLKIYEYVSMWCYIMEPIWWKC